jgi:hypothetical protein
MSSLTIRFYDKSTPCHCKHPEPVSVPDGDYYEHTEGYDEPVTVLNGKQFWGCDYCHNSISESLEVAKQSPYPPTKKKK